MHLLHLKYTKYRASTCRKSSSCLPLVWTSSLSRHGKLIPSLFSRLERLLVICSCSHYRSHTAHSESALIYATIVLAYTIYLGHQGAHPICFDPVALSPSPSASLSLSQRSPLLFSPFLSSVVLCFSLSLSPPL